MITPVPDPLVALIDSCLEPLARALALQGCSAALKSAIAKSSGESVDCVNMVLSLLFERGDLEFEVCSSRVNIGLVSALASPVSIESRLWCQDFNLTKVHVHKTVQ